MNRERVAWLMSILLLAVVAFRSPSAAQRDGDYTFVRTLVDIHRQVSGNYVEPVDEPGLEQAAINGMLGQLDPFTAYVPPARRKEFDRMLEGTFEGVGIQLNQRAPNGPVEVVTPIDGSPAFKAGVQAGDIILKVNGEAIEGLLLADVIKKIGGEMDSEVKLKVRHESGEEAELSMRRQEIVVPTIKGYTRKADNSWDWYISANPKIAYMRLTQFTPTTFENVKGVMQELVKEGMKGFILDLRWNPGGQLDQAVSVVDLFVDAGKTIVSTKGRNRPERVEKSTGPGTLPFFPMIVLVNEHSASAAEIVAGSLMDNRRAIVLGERSYGKGSVQELIPLEGNNGELKLTVAYYYLPSGRLVHKRKGAETWGVEPQILVPMDEETKQKVADERLGQEKFRHVATKPSTRPTTAGAQLADVQLQRALDTMVAMTILQGGSAPATTKATGKEGD